MQYVNPFVLSDDTYNRTIDPIKDYKEDTALYLSRQLGISLEEAQEFIKETIGKGGALEWHQPTLHYLQRDPDTLDRHQATTGIASYIYKHLKENSVIAPTLTTYSNSDEGVSLEAEFTDFNIEKRDITKGEMFAAIALGDADTAGYKKNEQIGYKTNNNGMSGAFASASNSLSNLTAHSSLTSTCRVTAAIGSTDNERFLSGARHYRNDEIALYNLLSISNNTDLEAVGNAITKYNLYVPTTEDVVNVIRHSARFYWRDETKFEKLRAFIDRLNDVEKAAFVYAGDLYQVKNYNDSFVRTFLSRMVEFDTTLTDAEYEALKGKVDYGLYGLAWKVRPEYTEEQEMKKHYGKGTEADRVITAMAFNMTHVLMDYYDFFKTFFTTFNLPPSNAFFPQAIRECVITGDTDSTIFTTQDWVKWYCGKVSIGRVEGAVSEVLVYMKEFSVAHYLAVMSANLGSSRKNLRREQMKNEYMFPVYGSSEIKKHYYAYEKIREGFINGTMKLDRKGLQYKASTAPVSVIALSDSLMERIMDTVYANEKISLREILVLVADYERKILADIENGGISFYRASKVKEAESYTKPATESPYRNYLMWNEIFGPSYGEAPVPPYNTFKIPLELTKKEKVKLFLSEFEDQACATRLQNWLNKGGRDNLNTLYVPMDLFTNKAIPRDIVSMVRVRDLVFDVMISCYLVLESMGYYFRNDAKTRLICDDY